MRDFGHLTVGGLRGTGSRDVAVNDVFVPSPFSAGFFDPHVLSEPRYRIPPFSRVIPGLGTMALGIARTAIESLKEIAGVKTPVRTTQMLRDTTDAQMRVSQAEALVRSAWLFLFDSVDQLWTDLLATGEVTMEARAQARLAASHAVANAVQAVDLDVHRRRRQFDIRKPPTGACVSRCACHNPAHRRTPARHALDRPSAVRP